MENLVAEFKHSGEYPMEFYGGNHVVVPNSDAINLAVWKFEIEFSFWDVDKGCFIFDKRNGQWHRNYCFGFITPLWFQHHPTDLTPGKYLFVDVGDGSPIVHELTNGLAIPAELIPDITYNAVGIYSGGILSLSLSSSPVEYNRSTPLGDVRGGGPLILGSAGNPYQNAWPEYGLGPFNGKISYSKFWEIGEVGG